jgi:sigma-B regulation protein RsbU (phosphoserine phosphatase)
VGNPSTPNVSWKHFLNVGEKILKKPNALAQCELIKQVIYKNLGLQAEVGLFRPYYPLPGETDCPSQVLSPSIAKKFFDFRHPESLVGLKSSHGKKARDFFFPIKTEDHILGFVRLQVQPKDDINVHLIEYLEGILTHAALAMQVRRQEVIKHWRSEQLSLVRKVSTQIKDVSDIHGVCQKIANTIQRTFKYYYAGIFLLNPELNELHLFGSSQVEGQEDLLHTIKTGMGIVGNAAATGEEVVANDVSREPLFLPHALLPDTRSEVAIPIKMGNRILGILDLQSEKLDAFKSLDISVMTVLADNIAIALTNANLFSNLKKRADQIHATLEVGHVLSSILDPETLLNEVVRLIHDRFGYLFVHLFLYQPATRQIIYRNGIGPETASTNDGQVVYDIDDPSGIIPWVARNRKSLLVNDVSKEPLYRTGYAALIVTKSELTVPLVFGKELLGILDVQSDQLNAFDKDDKNLIESLATSIAITVRNANLYRSEQWRRKVSDSFQDVARLLTEEVNIEKLLDLILSKLASNLPSDASAIWLISKSGTDQEERTPALHLGAVHGVSKDLVDEMQRPDWSAMAYLTRQLRSETAIIRLPGEDYEPLGMINHFAENYSAIIAPLRAGNKELGMLTIAHSAPGKYGLEASAITAAFANYAALALQNADNLANSQVQAWSSTILLQVAEAIKDLTSLDELFSTMARLAPLLFGIKKCGFFFWDEENQSFILRSEHNIPHEGDVRIHTDDSLAFQALSHEKALQFIQDPVNELKFPEIGNLEKGSKVILFPLLAHNALLGAFLVAYETIFHTGVEMPFSDQTLSLLQGIAHQTSIAAENIHLSEMRQEEAYVTAVLLQVAQAVVSLNGLDEIMETVMDLLPILVGIDCCMVYRWDEKKSTYTPMKGFFESKDEEELSFQKSYSSTEFKLLDWVKDHDANKTCRLKGAHIKPSQWPFVTCDEEPSQDDSSANLLMGFPISYRGIIYGVMVTRELNAKMQFHEKRMEIITGVCQQIALAIQNDKFQRETLEREKLQNEVQLAREIQETFLPSKLPHVPGWEMDFRWQTAREVSGDLYDVFMVHPHTLALVIADVSDKGMPAALYMTVTRTLVRAFSKRFDSPARVLEQVNSELLKDEANSLFVTGVFALVDTISGSITYCNAGHNPPVLFKRSTQLISPLQRTGMALGVIRENELFDRTVSLDAGDMLMLYTDGLTETFSVDGEAFGEERVILSLQMNQYRSVCDLLSALTGEVSEFRGNQPIEDDLTILAIQRLRR